MSGVGQVDRSRVTSVEPGPVRRSEALLRLWGDADSGRVNDWVYVSSERLYQIVLSLPPGGSFRHSEKNRTIFGADELYYVLSGRLLLANPETGEVCALEAGEAAWFGPDTWHHGFAQSERETQVLEFFAPPPAAGMSQAYARTKPYLAEARYVRAEPAAGDTIHRVDPGEIAWRLEGERQELLVGVLVGAERLAVARAEILPARATAERRHAGDLGLYILDGTLDVLIGGDLFHLAPTDGFFVPAGTPYRYANSSAAAASFMFALAPTGAEIGSSRG